MDALGPVLVGLLAAIAAVLLERVVVLGLRALWLRMRPVSGEHADSFVYQRNLWAPDQPDTLAVAAALVCSGLLLAAQLRGITGLLPAAALLWLGALAWDLWAWERVAASVKFVSWQRGWRKSARRVAISDLREVRVSEKRRLGRDLPSYLVPATCSLVLVLSDGKAVRLPRTGSLFGGAASVQKLADFVHMQMDMVADNRRRAAADKRAAARRAMQPPPPPMHQASKVDPGAIPFGITR
jgi:hypothetical protein